jgi:hypothetical protein
MSQNIENPNNEFESLNLEEMDVEELERRLELAVATTAGWGGSCGSNCDGFSKEPLLTDTTTAN